MGVGQLCSVRPTEVGSHHKMRLYEPTISSRVYIDQMRNLDRLSIALMKPMAGVVSGRTSTHSHDFITAISKPASVLPRIDELLQSACT